MKTHPISLPSASAAIGIDYWGLGLLILAIGALQIMLDKGQEDDWFGSRFIVTCSIVAIVGLAVFIVRELAIDHPVLDLRLFAQRNVGMTQLVMFMVGLSLYSSTVLIPQFLQEIMGYSARQAGMAVSSGGLVLMALFPVAGALAPKFDPRKLVAVGFVITTFGLWRMTEIDLNVSFGLAVSWRAVIALGLPFLFIPINTLCYAGIPQEKYNEVSGLTALMRNLGGSVGISFVTTLLARQSQKHLAMLAPARRPRQSALRAHALRPRRRLAASRLSQTRRHAARRRANLRHGPDSGPPPCLCRCHLDHGSGHRSLNPAPLHHAPPQQARPSARRSLRPLLLLPALVLAHQFCQRHIGLFANRRELGVAAPIAQEILAILLPQSTHKRISALLFDPPILIAMTTVQTCTHCPSSRLLPDEMSFYFRFGLRAECTNFSFRLCL